jgi:L-lactate dehydrogenase (cytochrome)
VSESASRALLGAAAWERLRRPSVGSRRVERCGSVAELRALARRRVPPAVFDYVDGAAGDELTLDANRRELSRLALLPRVLAGGERPDVATTVLGRRIELPILGAPTGLTGIVHHRGELALARAVNGAGSVYVLSAVGSYSIEEVARECAGPKWFQLYVWRDRGLVREMLERASAAGYGALVVTVDVPRAGARERDRRNGFTVPPALTLRTLLQGVRRPRWSADLVLRPRILPESARRTGASEGDALSLTDLINRQFDPTLGWADIAWLQDQWPGPIVLKGVLRAQDAEQAARLGVAGVIVSNHGGRQLDQASASIAALPPVVQAAGADLEVYFDGGIRRGVEVVKALALGARACLAGRALAYGLAAGGDAGAARAMGLLAEELRLAMTLAGCASLDDLDTSLIATKEG